MGAGYYLKAANRYSTGWKVEKWDLDKWRIEAIYLAAEEGRIRIAFAKCWYRKRTPETLAFAQSLTA